MFKQLASYNLIQNFKKNVRFGQAGHWDVEFEKQIRGIDRLGLHIVSNASFTSQLTHVLEDMHNEGYVAGVASMSNYEMISPTTNLSVWLQHQLEAKDGCLGNQLPRRSVPWVLLFRNFNRIVDHQDTPRLLDELHKSGINSSNLRVFVVSNRVYHVLSCKIRS